MSIDLSQSEWVGLLAALNHIKRVAEVVTDAADDMECVEPNSECWHIPARSAQRIAHFAYEQQTAVYAFEKALYAAAERKVP